MRQTDVLDGIFDDRERLQSEEVHLYQSGVLDDRAFVLRYEHLLAGLLVVGRADGHPVRDVVAADDRAARMHARAADVAFEHLGVHDRIVQYRLGRLLCRFQLGHCIDSVREVDLQQLVLVVRIGYAVGHELAEIVGLREAASVRAPRLSGPSWWPWCRR